MTNTKVREGIILIPDFSGFTEFVFNTKTHIGEYITKQLLSVLIDANRKHFYLSEIEGDAILFYRYNKKPCYNNVMEVLQRMTEAFNDKLSQLENDFSTKIDMSLKFIVHHGKFSKYTIKDFNKLYGKPVIEAHKLLKNEYAEHPSYILFTNSFLAVAKNNSYLILDNAVSIEGIGKIYYLDLELHKFTNGN